MRISQRKKRTSTRLRSAFSRATASALAEMSQALTCHMGRSFFRAMAMQPKPVPMSSTRNEPGLRFCASQRETSSAVSGRGISVAGVTRRSSPNHRACSNTYCTGSPCNKRSTARETSMESAFSGNSSTTQRASSRASEASKPAVSASVICLSRSSISAAKLILFFGINKKKTLFFAFYLHI